MVLAANLINSKKECAGIRSERIFYILEHTITLQCHNMVKKLPGDDYADW